MTIADKVKMLDGKEIPVFGFGCYNSYGEEITNAVAAALDAGYRYIDSAARYRNEAEVGAALKNFAGKREEIFVLSKVWPTAYDAVEASVEKSRKELGVEYLDAMLLHWPGTDETRRLRAYETLLQLRDKGRIGTVGVSNFQEEQIETIKEQFGAYPAILELEVHPGYQQNALQDFCAERGIVRIAYSPIGRGRYQENEVLQALSRKYGKTTSQVILRWHLQRGTVPIPKSGHKERILENADVFDFCLTEEEMEILRGLECGGRMGLDPLTFNG
ncbi:aldo/keto reductase [Hominifimenecus sp. rT4P-3]|uniref:aldo/keto reductase n=1 Tax=Hominifimenecus sp. rT4P-3 TaxID=3242979 RepID=UPI003DA537E4